MCTDKRQKILANHKIHTALIEAWKKANEWIIGQYIIMPDHIHLFCSPATGESVSVAQWVSYWKRIASQQINPEKPIWQRDCWDTQLRNHESYAEKWLYIKNNPVRKKLVTNPDDWPYQGVLNHLPW